MIGIISRGSAAVGRLGERDRDEADSSPGRGCHHSAGGRVLDSCLRLAGRRPATPAAKIVVVAAENFWGSIASQLGGSHVAGDQHHHQPGHRPARLRADRRRRPHGRRRRSSSIVNGIGYDPGPRKLLAANPVDGRTDAERRRPASALQGRRQPAPLVLPGDVHAGHRAASPPTTSSSTRPTPPTSTRQQHTLRDHRAGRRTTTLIAEIKRQVRRALRSAPRSRSSRCSPPALGLKLLTPDSFLERDQRGHRPDRGGQGHDRPQISEQADQGLRLQQPERHARRAARRSTRPRPRTSRSTTITETLDPGGRDLPGVAGRPAAAASQAALAKATGHA